jgi:molecular chaperone HtpG
MVRGLRVRSGNIQVGGHDLLQELFPEPRFNSWSVGEIYVVDSRIVPNGRRDHYEQSVHFDNVLNQLSPIAREIASRCRNSSLIRNWVREFERSEQSAKDKLGIIKQGTIGVGHQSEAAEDVKHILVKMERIAGRELIASEIRKSQRAAIGRIRRNLDKLSFHLPKAKVLARMSPKERRLLERVFNLVYECSANQNAAKMLVDRMLREMRGTS